LLDGYEEHARGIQAKLLARLHADLAQQCNAVQNTECQKEAISMDEDEAPSQTQAPIAVYHS
jgi:hypothetical protein